MSNRLSPVVYCNQRILTTQQTAKFLETTDKHINDNYQNNKDRYTEGKHFFVLKGSELKKFLGLYPENFGEQNVGKIRILYLWTEKGVLMHVKSVNTDIAWKAHEDLVDTYFRKEEQSQVKRLFPWTAEAEQLRQINMKYIQPGYWSCSEFVLQKLIYINLGNMTPNERAKIDISFGIFFSRWLKGDQSGQLKACTITPNQDFDETKMIKVGRVIDSKTGNFASVYHYANIYAGDRDNFWDLWYCPIIMPVYFHGKLPDGLPRMTLSQDIQAA